MQQIFVCPNCRSPISLGQRFCVSCGIAVSAGIPLRDKRTDLRSLLIESEYEEVISLISMDSSVAINLARFLEDANTEVRQNAAEAIARIGRNDPQVPDVIKVVMPIIMRLLDNREARIREAATDALTNIAWNWLMWEDLEQLITPAIPRLIELLSDVDLGVRRRALGGVKVVAEWREDRKVGFKQIESTFPRLRVFMGEPNLRADAVGTLRAIAHRNPEAVKPMLGEIAKLLTDSKEGVRLDGAAICAYVAEVYPGDLRAVTPSLNLLLENEWVKFREKAAIALGFLSTNAVEAQRILPELIRLLEDNHEDTCVSAIRVLTKIATIKPEVIEPALPQLRKLIEDPRKKVREGAVRVLELLPT